MILRLVEPTVRVIYDGPYPAPHLNVELGLFTAGTPLVFELDFNGSVERSDNPNAFQIISGNAHYLQDSDPTSLLSLDLLWEDSLRDHLIYVTLRFGYTVSTTEVVVVSDDMLGRPKGRRAHFS